MPHNKFPLSISVPSREAARPRGRILNSCARPPHTPISKLREAARPLGDPGVYNTFWRVPMYGNNTFPEFYNPTQTYCATQQVPSISPLVFLRARPRGREAGSWIPARGRLTRLFPSCARPRGRLGTRGFIILFEGSPCMVTIPFQNFSQPYTNILCHTTSSLYISICVPSREAARPRGRILNSCARPPHTPISKLREAARPLGDPGVYLEINRKTIFSVGLLALKINRKTPQNSIGIQKKINRNSKKNQ